MAETTSYTPRKKPASIPFAPVVAEKIAERIAANRMFPFETSAELAPITTDATFAAPSLSFPGISAAPTGATTTIGGAATPAAASYSYVPGAIGAYGAYDLLKRDDVSPGRGALQGAASGAGIGYTFGGPAGAGIGAGIGGAAGLIKSLFGGGSKTNIEEDRIKKLAQMGITLPTPAPRDTAAELASNPDFYNTRKEEFLRPVDITGYASFYEKVPGYQNLSQAQKEDIAKKALDLKLVREHKGTVDISPSKEFDDYVSSFKKK